MHSFIQLCRQRKRDLPRFWIMLLTSVHSLGDASLPPPSMASPASSRALHAAPAIQVLRDGDQVRIHFEGVLEAASEIAGPWQDVPAAVSPLAYEPVGPRTFFRVRTRTDESVFASSTVATLVLEGPMQMHFDLAFAGIPDGIFPPRRDKPYFPGSVWFAGFGLPAELRVRGNSSLQECPFPKLKFKVARADRQGTPFADAREIKVGTHCAEGGEGTVGRLRDQRAAFREALAYEVMARLGFVTPRVRRAHVEYRDTSPPTRNETEGWRVTREAFILEDIEVVAERLGGRALDDDEIAELTDAGFDEEPLTALRLLHALLGNWDYTLSLDGTELWNTDVIALPDGKLVPVAGDFDLASWVTGVLRSSAPHDYHPELGELEREARYQVETIQRETKASSFASARSRFVQARAAIEADVARALVDAAGRANAMQHMAAFYGALALTTR